MTSHTDPWSRVAHLWPLLAITRYPGTRRPWRPRELSASQRAERDARDKAERHLAEIFLEAQPAPLHLDVLDTLDELHRMLRDAAIYLGIERGLLAASGAALRDPRALLEACRAAARTKPDGIAVDEPAWAMLHTIEQALGEIYDGQKLAAECPWCHGGLAVDRQTWRVRILPGNMPAIVCESGTCEPPEAEAGTWWRGKPAWPLWEWNWLADRLDADSRKAS